MSEMTDLLQQIVDRLDTLILTVEDIKTEISLNDHSGIENSLSDIQSKLFNIQMAVQYPKKSTTTRRAGGLRMPP
jgi:hypothetical protein